MTATEGTPKHSDIADVRRSWTEILFTRKMLACIFLGFSSGMPLFVLVSLVPAWLRDNGVDLATIGLFALVGLPYTWKFLWSPVMDRFKLPFLGRRRGWALLTQVLLLVSIGLLGHFNPSTSIQAIVWIVFAVALFSASQDIVIDAYRRELLADDELGTGTSFWINAYRLSGLVPGSLALILADHLPWSTVFWITAAFMLVGIVTTLLVKEESDDDLAPHTLREAVIDPFVEFFSRDGIAAGLAILAFLFLYKLGDNMATALATPFYLDMGYSKTEIGSVAKFAGLWAVLAGATVGGIVMLKVSINRALWLFGFVQLLTIIPYIWLSQAGHSLAGLFVVVSGEYLAVGLGTVALTAFMARETSKAFTATQFALFSSLIAVPRTVANATTGFIVEAVGWTQFFVICTALAVPGMLMLFKVAPWNAEDENAEDQDPDDTALVEAEEEAGS
ncbi:AmpG family muropeptide MFS transporter [Methyloceanibacter methanicus]|uniref:AmpG family muropeptide MFS transporter n=1 Tax=Methyloceanibacter methanicus TaxID=1774968 RepID=A0A1E3W2A3_9HYPH|nr:AmpG family muropeptide MFS transporter [Methyloceanibacter methanicus]ODR99948.1 AmpG family muropeptide MFS transporter [Methyloceanibacter methanicus]